MSRPTEITKKLKQADLELSRYILELEKENLRLHKQVAKLQVNNLTKDNEIKALKQGQHKSESKNIPTTIEEFFALFDKLPQNEREKILAHGQEIERRLKA